MTATVARVSPNPKRVLLPEERDAIRRAMNASEAASQEVRNQVLAANKRGASVRAIAEFTGMSTDTIQRWKNGK